MPPKGQKRGRKSVAECLRDANAEYDDADLQEIVDLLKASPRKIPRCLRLVRGDDLLQEAAAAAPIYPDLMPATFSKFADVSKSVITAAVAQMDPRMSMDLIQEWDRNDRGIAWKLFHIGTGVQKNFALSGPLRRKATFSQVTAG